MTRFGGERLTRTVTEQPNGHRVEIDSPVDPHQNHSQLARTRPTRITTNRDPDLHPSPTVVPPAGFGGQPHPDAAIRQRLRAEPAESVRRGGEGERGGGQREEAQNTGNTRHRVRVIRLIWKGAPGGRQNNLLRYGKAG
ncbi:hypothetical protein JCM17961_04230 [Endothiovibrio diazotrophicus]